MDDLRDTVRSVVHQGSRDWELILVGRSSDSEAVQRLLDEDEARDPRIRSSLSTKKGGVTETGNEALAESGGIYVVLLHHGDLLTADALETMARAIEEHPDADYLYSDEDSIDSLEQVEAAFHKPDWSPERLRHQMYTGHLSVLRKSVVEACGGFHTGFEGAHEHDLVLRVTERGGRVVHVPKVLYHWRAIEGSAATPVREWPYSWDAGVRAVQAHLQRVGLAGECERGPRPGLYRIRRSVCAWPRITIVIPTRGAAGSVWGEPRCFVVEALRTALAKTELHDIEVIVVYDEQDSPRTVLDELRSVGGERLTLLPFTEPFNFSRKCNHGFLAATGQVIVLLNDDIEVLSDGWLEDLVAPLLQEQDVGMTGAQLLFSDGTLQHGGHTYRDGGWMHVYGGVVPEPDLDFGFLAVNREVSGVTAACVALRRDVYEEVGGLTETLPRNFNDVDLSFKIRRCGYRILWMGTVIMYHFESRTRKAGSEQWETDLTLGRWGTPIQDEFARLG